LKTGTNAQIKESVTTEIGKFNAHNYFELTQKLKKALDKKIASLKISAMTKIYKGVEIKFTKLLDETADELTKLYDKILKNYIDKRINENICKIVQEGIDARIEQVYNEKGNI